MPQEHDPQPWPHNWPHFPPPAPVPPQHYHYHYDLLSDPDVRHLLERQLRMSEQTQASIADLAGRISSLGGQFSNGLDAIRTELTKLYEKIREIPGSETVDLSPIDQAISGAQAIADQFTSLASDPDQDGIPGSAETDAAPEPEPAPEPTEPDVPVDEEPAPADPSEPATGPATGPTDTVPADDDAETITPVDQ